MIVNGVFFTDYFFPANSINFSVIISFSLLPVVESRKSGML